MESVFNYYGFVVVAHSHRDAMSNVARDTSADVAKVFMLYVVRVDV